jgi:Putative lumazine-binding
VRGHAVPPTSADHSAIEQTARDYIEGFYERNAVRMERALHPELAKRIVRADPESGRSQLVEMSALTLVQLTGARTDRPTPVAERRQDVAVLDVFENAASAKVVAGAWIDYLHLARWNGRWVIVNVLWEMKPGRPFTSWW